MVYLFSPSPSNSGSLQKKMGRRGEEKGGGIKGARLTWLGQLWSGLGASTESHEGWFQGYFLVTCLNVTHCPITTSLHRYLVRGSAPLAWLTTQSSPLQCLVLQVLPSQTFSTKVTSPAGLWLSSAYRCITSILHLRMAVFPLYPSVSVSKFPPFIQTLVRLN